MNPHDREHLDLDQPHPAPCHCTPELVTGLGITVTGRGAPEHPYVIEQPTPPPHPEVVDAAHAYLRAVTMAHRWAVATLIYCLNLGGVTLTLWLLGNPISARVWFGFALVLIVVLSCSVVANRYRTPMRNQLFDARSRHPATTPLPAMDTEIVDWARTIITNAEDGPR